MGELYLFKSLHPVTEEKASSPIFGRTLRYFLLTSQITEDRLKDRPNTGCVSFEDTHFVSSRREHVPGWAICKCMSAATMDAGMTAGWHKVWNKTSDTVLAWNFLHMAEIWKAEIVYRYSFLPLPLMSNRIPQQEEKRVVFIPSPQKVPVGGSDPEGRFQCTIWRLLHPQSYIKWELPHSTGSTPF